MKVKEELKKYLGVKGIPYFVVGVENFTSRKIYDSFDNHLRNFLGQIDGKEEFCGAQPTEVFLAAFESAKKW